MDSLMQQPIRTSCNSGGLPNPKRTLASVREQPQACLSSISTRGTAGTTHSPSWKGTTEDCQRQSRLLRVVEVGIYSSPTQEDLFRANYFCQESISKPMAAMW